MLKRSTHEQKTFSKLKWSNLRLQAAMLAQPLYNNFLTLILYCGGVTQPRTKIVECGMVPYIAKHSHRCDFCISEIEGPVPPVFLIALL